MGRQRVRPRRGAPLIAFLVIASSLAGARATPATEAVPDSAQSPGAPPPATLVLQGVPVMTFLAPIGELTPAQRAAAALDRLEKLRPPHLGDSIRVHPVSDARVLMVGSTLAFTVLQEDIPHGSNLTIDQTTDAVRTRLALGLKARAALWAPHYWLRALLNLVIATAALVLLIILLVQGGKRIRRWISPADDAKRRHLLVGEVDLSRRLSWLLEWLLRAVIVVTVVIILQTWLTFVLDLFPATQPLARAVREFLIRLAGGFGNAVWRGLPGLITVALILWAASFVSGFLNEFFAAIEAGTATVLGVHPETARATSRLVSVLVWILAVVIAYPFIPGAQTDIFKGVSVFLGLIVTLGSAGVVGHMMSGLVLVFSRALREGDYVRVGDVEGFVLEVGTLSTKITNPINEEFTIPNMVMVGSTIKNFTRLSRALGAPLTASVTIGYEAPWRVVHEMLLGAAARTPGIRKEPAPFVLQASLSDFYVEYRLAARLEEPERRLIVLSALHQNIQDAFNDRGVQIMVPHFEGQPDRPVTVPRSKWNIAPGDAERDVARDRPT